MTLNVHIDEFDRLIIMVAFEKNNNIEIIEYMNFLSSIHKSPIRELFVIIGVLGSIASIYALFFQRETPVKEVIEELQKSKPQLTTEIGNAPLGLTLNEYYEKIKKVHRVFAERDVFLDYANGKSVLWIGTVLNVDQSEIGPVYVTVSDDEKSSNLAIFIFFGNLEKVANALRYGDKVKCRGTIRRFYSTVPILVGHALEIN